MLRIRLFFTLLWDVVNFAKKRREAREHSSVERLLERKHQLQMIEALGAKLVDALSAQHAVINKMAEASIAQSEAFSTWLKGFQSPVSPSGELSSVVRDEDEWAEEQERLRASGFPADLPPEFQYAALLKRLGEDAENLDREGSDF